MMIMTQDDLMLYGIYEVDGGLCRYQGLSAGLYCFRRLDTGLTVEVYDLTTVALPMVPSMYEVGPPVSEVTPQDDQVETQVPEVLPKDTGRSSKRRKVDD